uniref:Uncharacterized protein n=1 Tax=Globodera rostochiensis TaxID=31243 RepID=A0A914I364_GLORO
MGKDLGEGAPETREAIRASLTIPAEYPITKLATLATRHLAQTQQKDTRHTNSSCAASHSIDLITTPTTPGLSTATTNGKAQQPQEKAKQTRNKEERESEGMKKKGKSGKGRKQKADGHTRPVRIN